jgi:zinc transporter 5/7
MVFSFANYVGDINGNTLFVWSVAVMSRRNVFLRTRIPIGGYPKKLQVSDGLPHAPVTQVARSHLKTIMSNPESRRIFYFLVLNLSYMMVQMLYGVWTNSLGLISDGMWPKFHGIIIVIKLDLSAAIHMGFDCMAIGVGLLASIMATWPPNERFTYGLVTFFTCPRN